MPKTGWKFTKQQPNKNKTNMLKRSAASSKPNRIAPKNGGRSAETIKRLKMYSNGKAIRNSEGKIVGGQFMMKNRAGDTEITAGKGTFIKNYAKFFYKIQFFISSFISL